MLVCLLRVLFFFVPSLSNSLKLSNSLLGPNARMWCPRPDRQSHGDMRMVVSEKFNQVWEGFGTNKTRFLYDLMRPLLQLFLQENKALRGVAISAVFGYVVLVLLGFTSLCVGYVFLFFCYSISQHVIPPLCLPLSLFMLLGSMLTAEYQQTKCLQVSTTQTILSLDSIATSVNPDALKAFTNQFEVWYGQCVSS
jgi:uncharacterized protein YggT (Ycf19 family)